MAQPASPSLQKEYPRCSGAGRHTAPRPAPFQGTRHCLLPHRVHKEKSPGWRLSHPALGFLRVETACRHLRGPALSVVAGTWWCLGSTWPSAPSCCLSLKLSDGTLLQISRCLVPSPHPTPTGRFQKFDGEQLSCPKNCAKPHIRYRSWAFSAADGSARCGLGSVHESRLTSSSSCPRDRR